MRTTRREEEPKINLGDPAKCPQCGRIGRVVYISHDGKVVGIQCPQSHTQISRGASRLGSTSRPQTKPDKNMVFLTEVETASTISPIRR